MESGNDESRRFIQSTGLPINDGVPKLKDFPAQIAGSGRESLNNDSFPNSLDHYFRWTRTAIAECGSLLKAKQPSPYELGCR
jgi:hypothetical protein